MGPLHVRIGATAEKYIVSFVGCAFADENKHIKLAIQSHRCCCELTISCPSLIVGVPVPVNRMALQITTDGNPNCRKEESFADLGK